MFGKGEGGGCDLGGVRGLLRNGVVVWEGRKQTLAGDALRREGGARGGGGPLWEGRGGGLVLEGGGRSSECLHREKGGGWADFRSHGGCCGDEAAHTAPGGSWAGAAPPLLPHGPSRRAVGAEPPHTADIGAAHRGRPRLRGVRPAPSAVRGGGGRRGGGAGGSARQRGRPPAVLRPSAAVLRGRPQPAELRRQRSAAPLHRARQPAVRPAPRAEPRPFRAKPRPLICMPSAAPLAHRPLELHAKLRPLDLHVPPRPLSPPGHAHAVTPALRGAFHHRATPTLWPRPQPHLRAQAPPTRPAPPSTKPRPRPASSFACRAPPPTPIPIGSLQQATPPTAHPPP